MRISDWSSDVCSSDLEFLDGGIYTIERLITNGSGWCDDVTTTEAESCEMQIARALEMALDHLSCRFGSDMAAWRWGEAHAARFDHALLGRLPVLRELFTYSIEADGGNDTVNRATARLGGNPDTLFEDVHGAGFRAVYDLENLDRRSDEHTSELQALMANSNALF